MHHLAVSRSPLGGNDAPAVSVGSVRYPGVRCCRPGIAGHDQHTGDPGRDTLPVDDVTLGYLDFDVEAGTADLGETVFGGIAVESP